METAAAPCLIVVGILVALTLPLIPALIPTMAPSSTQSGFVSLHSQALPYEVMWTLYLVSDVIYLIGFFALYFIFSRVNKVLISLTVVLNTLFVLVDVGLDIPLRLSLVSLSNSYAATQGSVTLSSAQTTINNSNLVALASHGMPIHCDHPCKLFDEK